MIPTSTLNIAVICITLIILLYMSYKHDKEHDQDVRSDEDIKNPGEIWTINEYKKETEEINKK